VICCRCSTTASIASEWWPSVRRARWCRRWGPRSFNWTKETSSSCRTARHWSVLHWRLEQYVSASCYCNWRLHSACFLPVQIVADVCCFVERFCLFVIWCLAVGWDYVLCGMTSTCSAAVMRLLLLSIFLSLMPFVLTLCFHRLLTITV